LRRKEGRPRVSDETGNFTEEVHRQAEGLQGMAEDSQDNEDKGTLGNSQSQIERTLRLLWINRQPARNQKIRRGSEEAVI